MVITLLILTFTGELAVMLPTGLVAAHHAADLLAVLVLHHGAPVTVQAPGGGAGHGRGGGGGCAVDLGLHPGLWPRLR